MAPQSTAAQRNKLVIRRLPPTLPEEIFWKSVAEWVNDETCLWRRYVKGKPGDGNYDAHYTHSRAYVLMATPQALVDFHRAFDGHVFRAKTGAEFQTVVEYAPVQKTPYKIKVKTDTRQGTIDEDPDFKSFLDILNAPVSKAPLEVSVPISQPSTTPLLDHLRSQGRGARSKTKGKSAASTSESSRRAAALASVNAAAQKRQAQAAPVMVAGKGREVVIAQPEGGGTTVHEPLASGVGAQEGKKRGGRGRGKGKKEKEQGVEAAPGKASQAGPSKSGHQTPADPAAPTSGLPATVTATNGRPTPKNPGQIKQPSGRATPLAPPPRIDQPPPQPQPVAPALIPPRQPPLPGRGAPLVRGGRGAVPGGRGGRGGGAGRGGAQQIQILARTGAVGSGAGAGAGAGGARGGRSGKGGGAPAAAGAPRIDM